MRDPVITPAPAAARQVPKTDDVPKIQLKPELQAAWGIMIMGAFSGCLTGYATWGETLVAALCGLAGGAAGGAVVGHSLLLPMQWQAVVVAVLLTLTFSLYDMLTPYHVPMLALPMAGGATLICSYALHRVFSGSKTETP